MNCQICGNGENLEEYAAKEMLLGTCDRFHYFQCPECWCLQIAAIPENMTPAEICVLRIPTVSSDAWRQYKTDWVSLDAPRYLFLHSIKSINMLAEESRLKVAAILYDALPKQFWGSEMIKRDISLLAEEDAGSRRKFFLSHFFHCIAWHYRTYQWNRERRGDQIVIFLKPA